MRLTLLLVLIAAVSCRGKRTLLSDFDTAAWQQDRGGCSGMRTAMQATLERQHNKLKALTEEQTLELLGRPDRNELLGRNQKIYTYYIDPGPDCPQKANSSNRLILRFNAVGLAKEVIVAQ